MDGRWKWESGIEGDKNEGRRKGNSKGVEKIIYNEVPISHIFLLIQTHECMGLNSDSGQPGSITMNQTRPKIIYINTYGMTKGPFGWA